MAPTIPVDPALFAVLWSTSRVFYAVTPIVVVLLGALLIWHTHGLFAAQAARASDEPARSGWPAAARRRTTAAAALLALILLVGAVLAAWYLGAMFGGVRTEVLVEDVPVSETVVGPIGEASADAPVQVTVIEHADGSTTEVRTRDVPVSETVVIPIGETSADAPIAVTVIEHADGSTTEVRTEDVPVSETVVEPMAEPQPQIIGYYSLAALIFDVLSAVTPLALVLLCAFQLWSTRRLVCALRAQDREAGQQGKEDRPAGPQGGPTGPQDG